MKNKIISSAIFLLFLTISFYAKAQQSGVTVNKQKAAITNKQGKGAIVKKGEVKATGKKGGGAVANKSGTSIKNAKGGGVTAEKHHVAAKSASGKGVDVNNKGLNIKGGKDGKGGMSISKGKVQIKGKNADINLGKK